MKKTLQLTVLYLLLCAATYAQNVPQGMKYQAVARSLSGNIIANQEISLRISLLTNDKSATVHYSEVHTVITNQLGLFTLVIGEGKIEKGTFASIPWSTDDIWMQVSIKDKGSSSFTTISNSKLLAVPYAFHAGTASQLVNQKASGSSDVSTIAASSSSTTVATSVSGVPSAPWMTKGNSATDPLTDHLGTTDAADLVIITNNIERLRISLNGDVDLKNKLTVGNDLTVKQNAYLNTIGGATNIKGAATLQNTLTVGGATALNDKLDITGIATSTNNMQSTAANNGALVVAGGVGIGGNVNVGGMTTLTGAANLQNTLDVTGATHLKSTVTADGVTTITNTTESSTIGNGALVVAGGTGVGGNLNVHGATTLGNTVAVLGITTSENNTQSTSVTNGAMVVAGGVGIGGNLNVGGSANIGSINASSSIGAKGLNIVNDTSSYLATFQNTNTGEGDGIKIKLGRAKSAYTIPAAPTLDSASDFRDLLNCQFSEAQKVSKLATIVANDAVETAKTMAGIAVSAGNMIINVINSGLNLPLSIPDVTVPQLPLSPAFNFTQPINDNLKLPIKLPNIDVIPKVDLGVTSIGPYSIGGQTIVPALPDLTIPAITIPQTQLLSGREVMPKLPQINLTSIGIPAIDISGLQFWGLDINICLDEGTTSPLNNSNEFIRFADKNDAQVGSVRGVSVANWAASYLNPVFFAKLRGAFLSSKADKFHAQYHFKTEIKTALASYAKIGVEYSSGNGDYAEWLERSDKMEAISAGDIVSVKGGKITKDLTGAEQVMVVSHAPIMLGNMPSASKTDLGNSIVFIGQAPVKIMGAVRSGDYIIGQVNTPGYGIAKHPNDMTIEDFKLAVGRSWDTDETEGLKMANTVVGIHNSSFLNLIKGLKEKAENNDARLKAIEAKLSIAPVKKSSFGAKKHK